MKSIHTLFLRNRESRELIDKVVKAVDWVMTGKGVPTRKYDGIAIRIENGSAWRRLEWKPGSPLPNGFIRCADPNPKFVDATIPGWVPVSEDFVNSPMNTDEKYLSEAWKLAIADMKQIMTLKAATKLAMNHYAPEEKQVEPTLPNGTYELCGPDIRGNHEKLTHHRLFPHGTDLVKHVPRTFAGLQKFLETYEGEGIVWHYRLGPVTMMAKIKRSDFGFFGRPEPKVEEKKEEVQKEEQACDSLASSA